MQLRLSALTVVVQEWVSRRDTGVSADGHVGIMIANAEATPVLDRSMVTVLCEEGFPL